MPAGCYGASHRSVPGGPHATFCRVRLVTHAFRRAMMSYRQICKSRMSSCSLTAWRACRPQSLMCQLAYRGRSKKQNTGDIRKGYSPVFCFAITYNRIWFSLFYASLLVSFSIDMNSSPVMVSFSYRNRASLSRLLRFSRSIFLAFSCCCFTSCTTFLSISF